MSKHKRTSTLHKHYEQLALIVVKLAVVILAALFIYNKLTNNDTLDVDYFLELLIRYDIFSLKNISILFLLSISNWLLESLKWKILVNEITHISFKKAISQSLSALTASIITPNRVGEYGVKAIYYPKRFRKKILGLNLIGNLSQMLITVLFGCIGLLYFTNIYNVSIIKYSHFSILTITFIIIGILVVCLLLVKKQKIIKKVFSRTIIFCKKLNSKTIIITLLIAVIKYLVFSHQFYFLIAIFKLNITYFEAMSCIFSMYIIASIIPTVFILDLVVKGSVAVWLFGFANANEFLILAITSIMWCLNFAIPSIIGSYFVLNFKLNKD